MKQSNEYAKTLGKWYDKIPKAVLAAVAVSFATQGGDNLEQALVAVMTEWNTLHLNGIVPQKPPSGVTVLGIGDAK